MSFVEVPEGQDVFELLRESDKAAKEAAKFCQKWIDLFVPGTKYAKINEEADLIIYGEILDPLSMVEDEEELEYIKELYESSPERRFVKAYSVACEEGELGDEWPQTIHFILTEEDFQLAKAMRWPQDHVPSRDKTKIKFVGDVLK
jgi:disulfide oxidoreductase YuzD